MSSVRQAEIPVVGAGGDARGLLRIQLLARQTEYKSPAPLIHQPVDEDRPAEAVQVLEGNEYLYEFQSDPLGAIETDRAEMFNPDTRDGRRGRLRPGLYTGSVPVRVFVDGEELGTLTFEVRSKKLDYEQHYRWMLRDIATDMAEVVMDRFAPSEQHFRIDDSRDAETLYQRFAFLRSLIAGREFEAALRQILGRPYIAWEEVSESRRPSRGVPPSSAIVRQIARGAARVPWPSGPAGLRSLPEQLSVSRTEPTLDTVPNRFVKFALQHWRDIVSLIGDALQKYDRTAPVDRGVREVRELLNELDQLLAEDLFREVGSLGHFPVGNQVLQKRAGYRVVFRAYVEFDLASQLLWDGGADVFAAGQRNVATLYEYWTFIQLANVVGSLCDEPFDFGSLLAVSRDGLSIRLRRGSRSVLRGMVTRGGRRISMRLHFNRSFNRSSASESWTTTMRPDCSLHFSPMGYGNRNQDVWLHFDAKYRVNSIRDLFGSGDDSAEDGGGDPEPRGTALREDLLKMHAYRDAIQRSVGAYVLYPGTEAEEFRRHHEILPGLGAFPLYPTHEGDARGTQELYGFIDDVINHLASQLTQHERARYWHGRAYEDEGGPEETGSWTPFLHQPPADTPTLLGFVKSQSHYDWIVKNAVYNVRATGDRGRVGVRSQELAVQFLVLYGPSLEEVEIFRVAGEPEVRSRSTMLATGYPSPSAEMYFCLPVAAVNVEDWSGPDSDTIERLRQRVRPGVIPGAPVACSWGQFVSVTASGTQ